MKRIISLLLLVVMFCSTFAGLQISSSARTSSGSCGNGVTYTFDESTGLVTISGSGEMWDFNFYDNISPFSYNVLVKKVIINNGVTSIGDCAFSYCELTSITIPDSITIINDSAFYDCSNLTDIYYTGTQEMWEEIDIQEWNEDLLNANLHLNTQPVHTHEYVSAITTPATCTEPGVMTYTCICGEKYTDVIPATGHKSIVLNAVEPTCTKTGLTEGEKCSVCGEMIKAQNTINALGHDYTEDVTAPTCTQYGYTTYTCSRCWDSYIGDIVSAKEHRSAAAVKENEKSATCTATGSYDEVVYCSDCGAEISRTPKTVVALGHDYGSWTQIKAPTCTAKGEETRVCKRDASHKETRETAAFGHNADVKKVVKPGATQLGYTEHRCSRCDVLGKTDTYTAPTGKLTLKHSARTANAIKVQWNNVKTATGYQVQISTKDGKKWDTYYNLKSGVTNFTFKKLAAGNNYKFRVRFYIKAADKKNYFSPWSATLNSPTLPKGTAVKLFTAKKAFTAKWTKIAGVTGYQVQYATNAKFRKAVTKTVKGASKYSLAVKNLKGGARYYVRIRTYKTIGGKNYFSAWSPAKAVTTKR